jgi:hypothetical protein
MFDFHFAHHGSITVLLPLTEAAQAWVDEHIAQNDETQYWGGGIVIEPRYVQPILAAIVAEGLEVGRAF